ncbi:MAG: class I SAM-dependent methyltransferase [Planctomycetaceae bacterium]|jgi:SAM-dependent methyltransferase|nr:class I SAM-dependent methyltransferase [Planctomycetaceae bacterium]
MTKNIPGTEGEKRLFPKPWDYSCYLLLKLKKAIASIIREVRYTGNNLPLKVLDYGCGTRPYEPLFKEQSIKYIGADIIGNPVADIHFQPGKTLQIENQSVDILFSSQVLEHVENVSGYMSECFRVLKPQGLLILSTHGYWTYHGYPEDYRRWTFFGLKSEIENAHFTVQNIIPCVGPLAYTTHLRSQLIRGFLYKFAPISLPLIGLVKTTASLLMLLEDWITPKQVKDENSAVYVVEARRNNNIL